MQEVRKIGWPAAAAIGVGTLLLGLLIGLNWGSVAYTVADTLGFCEGRVGRAPLSVCHRDELDFEDLNRIYQELALNFDGALDREQLLEGAKRGMVEAVGDQWTHFMTRAEATDYRRALSGDIGFGVGVEIGRRGGAIVVLRVIDGNPAQRAGLSTGDVIIAVDGKEVGEMSASEAADLVRGPNGSEVTLTVRRDEREREVTMRREKINNPSVLLTYDGNVAIIRVTRFDRETGELMSGAINDARKNNVVGVVLDLRGNGGGYVDSAQEVLGLWLDNQHVMTERTQFRTLELRSAARRVQMDGLKTVVLIDGGTASAAEIVAGALRHYNKATILGEESYGKGSVQRMVDLPRGELLVVTMARWLLPDGTNLSEQGLEPDEVVEMTLEDLAALRDPQLAAGVKLIRR
ncbi:S41 family peptidase [Candidatus Saccharibacteria bacterium]|nr:S41 family peptidase [Candidatus Saccharibacteria bacterium]